MSKTIEQKSLAAQIKLLDEIQQDQSMIEHALRSIAGRLHNEITEPIMFEQKPKLTAEQVGKLRQFLCVIKAGEQEYYNLNDSLLTSYVNSKREKLRFYKMIAAD